jgi:Tfp pilus assembly protein PilF
VAPNLTISSPAPVLIRPGTSAAVLPPATLTKPTDIEVTRLQEEPEIKPPQEIVARSEAATAPSSPAPASAGPVVLPDTNAKPKRNFFDRINPFRTRTKPAPTDSVVTTVPDASPEVAASNASLPPATAAADPSPPLAVPRYAYGSPAKPAPGDRTAALRLLAQGFEDHKAGKLARSNARYKEAVQADPSCFEAHFNLGLAAYELGNWKESLAAYELALALKPDSEDARYNFALALKRANYPLDAAQELEKLLQQHPDEARAHYSLANLYAHQLDQPDLAKPHYRKVLELDPRHPEAGNIRYWLAQHP